VVDMRIFPENGRGRPKHVTSYAVDKLTGGLIQSYNVLRWWWCFLW